MVMGIVPEVSSYVRVIVFVTMLGVGVGVELESVVVFVEVRPTKSPAIVTSVMPLKQYSVYLQAPSVKYIMVLRSYPYPADPSSFQLLVHFIFDSVLTSRVRNEVPPYVKVYAE